MTGLTHPHHRPPWYRRGLTALAREDGASMAELLIGMALMIVFMSMFTGAVVMMNTSVIKAESVNQSSVQVNQAFLKLDTAVRYAAAISPPGKGVAGAWYVELRTTNTGIQVCTPIRIPPIVGYSVNDAQRLQWRTWTVTGTAVSALTDWTQLATSITNGDVLVGSADQPFLLVEPVGVDFQQLTVRLVSSNGTTSKSSRSVLGFTAINSVRPPPSGPICVLPGGLSAARP